MKRRIARKALPFFMLMLNLALSAVVVLLMRHVQDLLDMDVKINLTEIVTQNKDAITSRLLMNIRGLDVTANRVIERMRLANVTDPESVQRFLLTYAKENNSHSRFVATSTGLVPWKDGTSLNISGRKYFRLAISGTPNISDKTVSRINGEESFVLSVPIHYRGEIVGTVQQGYTHDEMYRMCSLPLFASQGFTYIINSEGYIVVHAAHDNCMMRSDNYFRDLYMLGNKAASEQLERDIRQKRSGFMETTMGDRKLFAAYAAIDGVHDWFLITAVPVLTVSPNSNVVIKIFYVILLVIVLIFSSSITYFLWYKNKQRATLEKIAFVDTITGGNTYNKFVVDATEALQQDPHAAFWVMMVDVKNFKYINRFHGFEFGDHILKHIAGKLAGQMQRGEKCARISGDHFVLLLRHAAENRLHAMMASLESEEIKLYFAAGVYAIGDKDESVNLMVDKAGMASQTVKDALRNSLAFYTEELGRMSEHNEQLKRAVRRGLDNMEFVPYFQPKVDINSGRLVGCEALARWATAKGDFFSPGQFIPLCEQTGIIVELDMMVFEQVLQFIKAQTDANVPCVPVSVNFSRLHLADAFFFDTVAGLLKKYGVDPGLIELELTESAIFDNCMSIRDFTTQAHDIGLLVAMDDFGSGYSSLNMLKDVPIDILKIDKGFLDEALDNSRRDIIFSSIVAMAKSLNMRIVVEGVEYAENILLMRACGCSVAQGYYFAKPMPSHEFQAMLAIALVPVHPASQD